MTIWDIHADIIATLENDAPSYATVKKWVAEFKETKSATMNIFRKNSFLFKSFVKAELS